MKSNIAQNKGARNASFVFHLCYMLICSCETTIKRPLENPMEINKKSIKQRS